MLSHMSSQITAVNAPHFKTPFPGSSQPWDAPDPLAVMRRELKLLLIERDLLRGEIERLRAIEQSRDQWRREAEHLRALIAQVPSWALFWRRCLNGLKALLKPTDQWHHA
jgi:hypothetical protein